MALLSSHNLNNEMSLYIQNRPEKIFFIKIKVIPQASCTEVIEKLADNTWKIRVKAIPEKGKANNVIESFFKKQFVLKNAEIVGGKIHRMKIIRLEKM